MSDPNNAAEFEDFGEPATGQQENQGEQQHAEHAGGEHDQFFDQSNAFAGGNEGQHDEGFGENQGYEAHHQDQFEGGHQEEHYEQPQHTAQTGGDNYDDFFGAQQAAPGSAGVQFGGQQGIAQVISPGSGKGGMQAYGEEYDPEEEERLERLRRIEQERNQRLDAKAHEEREKKQEKIAEAAKELSRWHSEREQNNEKRRQINKQNQEIKNETNTEEEYKNPWDKIVGNIATKEGEYPGTKDVTRFRQSLVNKKGDEGKNIQKLADY